MKKMFFALWPDQKTRKKLTRLVHDLDTSSMKPVQAGNFHVTLVFLGSVEDAEIARIKQLAMGWSGKPFSIVFDQLHYWHKPKILCLGSSKVPQEINNLAGALNTMVSEIGIATDKRPYFAHVTLAKKARQLIDLDFEPVTWHAESFALVESVSDSGGPRYSVVQSWSLAKC